ncbi:MAG: ornithine cyclodeaminase family protein [Proteobacteria bacterium]|nr:ornithine cyclodeaminase family protein [Pseudomonadota bacterium]
MKNLTLHYLNARDIKALEMTADEIIAAQEGSLAAQGRGETVIEPRMHLRPDSEFRGHFNVLRGYIAPIGIAGIKVVGDFIDNYKLGYPSEFGMLTLMDARTGVPRAVIDATAITDMRTGAMTAVGAKYLAPSKPKVLGHIGARGSSYWNVKLLDHLFDFDEIRVHSRRPESRNSFGERLSDDLGKVVTVTEDWQSCLEGADIMVEASRLETPEPLFRTEWVRPGALVIPYGTQSTVEDNITDIMDKILVDHWGQCLIGPFGCLRRHVDEGRVTRDTIHGEIGSVCANELTGRESDDETILFWHRGLSTSDIALGWAMLEKAKRLNIGTVLDYT